MQVVRGIIIAAIVVIAAASYWFTNRAEEPGFRLLPDNPEITTRGSEIYAAQCASCHGANLEGQPNWRERRADGRLPAPPHDKTGHTWHHTDAVLFDLVKRGPSAVIGSGYQSDMPGYKEVLMDEDIVAVLSYIKSTWPEEIRSQHNSRNRAKP